MLHPFGVVLEAKQRNAILPLQRCFNRAWEARQCKRKAFPTRLIQIHLSVLGKVLETVTPRCVNRVHKQNERNV